MTKEKYMREKPRVPSKVGLIISSFSLPFRSTSDVDVITYSKYKCFTILQTEVEQNCRDYEHTHALCLPHTQANGE